MIQKEKIRWLTELEIVDEDTGEVIHKYQVENKTYIIIKKEQKYEFTENNNGDKTGRRKITWVCRRNPQQTLF